MQSAALFAASWERMVLIAALDRETSGGANEDARRTRCARLMLEVLELHPPSDRWRIQPVRGKPPTEVRE